MKNVVMLLVAVLGTSVMVSAAPAPVKATPAKELRVKHPRHKAVKKAKEEKSATSKTEAANVKK
jgi:hypothetical protein